jgi:hypothetical protein
LLGERGLRLAPVSISFPAKDANQRVTLSKMRKIAYKYTGAGIAKLVPGHIIITTDLVNIGRSGERRGWMEVAGRGPVTLGQSQTVWKL